MKHAYLQTILYYTAALLLWSVAHPGGPCNTHAGIITDGLRSKVASIITIAGDHSYNTPEDQDTKPARLHEIADTAFDWEEIAQRTLCDYWHELSSGQQRTFCEKFSDFLCCVYLKKLESFLSRRQAFTPDAIHYNEEITAGEYAMVRTTVGSGEGAPEIDYKLRLKNNHWLIYDVVINNVGFVADYKSQCNRILVHDGFNALIERLDSKEDMENNVAQN